MPLAEDFQREQRQAAKEAKQKHRNTKQNGPRHLVKDPAITLTEGHHWKWQISRGN